jgi:hypothetical protein
MLSERVDLDACVQSLLNTDGPTNFVGEFFTMTDAYCPAG